MACKNKKNKYIFEKIGNSATYHNVFFHQELSVFISNVVLLVVLKHYLVVE